MYDWYHVTTNQLLKMKCMRLCTNQKTNEHFLVTVSTVWSGGQWAIVCCIWTGWSSLKCFLDLRKFSDSLWAWNIAAINSGMYLYSFLIFAGVTSHFLDYFLYFRWYVCSPLAVVATCLLQWALWSSTANCVLAKCASFLEVMLTKSDARVTLPTCIQFS